MERALGAQLQAQGAYRDWVRGRVDSTTQQRRDGELQQPRKQVALRGPKRKRWGLRWDSHQVVAGTPYAFCVVCGLEATQTRKGCLAATPCPGPQALKCRHRMGLRAGLFDEAVRQARPAVQVAARAAGWRG